MRISLKFIALLWVGLLIIIGGLLFNAYSKFKPETFIALLTEQVQKNYPGAKLNVGKIAYRFSLDFNLKLKEIHLRRSGKLLGSIGEIELKVPWWVLLVNRGSARVSLSNLDIFIDQETAHTVEDKPATPEAKTIKVEIPSYFADTKFTLKASSISIRDIHNARRYFTVSKLLVREFQYGKNSAFEVNIPIEINHNGAQYLSDLWLFGDVTPEPAQWKLNYRGEFRSRENTDKFHIDDLVIIGNTSFQPSSLGVSSEINLLDEKEPIGSGQVTANQDNLNIVIKFDKLPLDYFSFIYESIKNPYLVKLDGHATGELKFKKKFDSSKADIDGKLNFPGDLFLADKHSVPGQWQVGFQNTRWEVSFISPKGEVSFFRRSVLDGKQNKVNLFSEELGFTGMELNKTIGIVKPLDRFINEPNDFFYTTAITCKKCVLQDKLVDGSFRYGQSVGQKFYQGDLTDENSSFKVIFGSKGGNKKSLDVNFSQFNWQKSFQLLEPYFNADSGIIDGKLEGRWEDSWESGLWLTQITGKGLTGEKGLVTDFITKSASFFGPYPKEIKPTALNVSVKNNILSLNSLLLESAESVKITGSLSSKQKSTLTLSYPKNKSFKPIKKEVIEPYWMQKDEK